MPQLIHGPDNDPWGSNRNPIEIFFNFVCWLAKETKSRLDKHGKVKIKNTILSLKKVLERKFPLSWQNKKKQQRFINSYKNGTYNSPGFNILFDNDIEIDVSIAIKGVDNFLEDVFWLRDLELDIFPLHARIITNEMEDSQLTAFNPSLIANHVTILLFDSFFF